MTEKGSVLILSLWIFALLGLLAGSLAYRTRIEIRLSQMPAEELRLSALAREAVYRCSDMWRASTAHYASFNQAWHDNPPVFKDRVLEQGTFTASHEDLFGVEDESSRMNLNRASPEALRRLFGVHANIVPAILRWRGSLEPIPHEYDEFGYKARGAAFKSLEELRLVRGMNDDIYYEVQPYLTVVAEDGVNLNTASTRVLEAIGLGRTLAQKIQWYRQGVDGREGTADDGVFQSVAQVVSSLQARSSISSDDVRALAVPLNNNQLTVQSEALRLRLSVRLNNSRARRDYTVVSTARVPPTRILFWQEGRR